MYHAVKDNKFTGVSYDKLSDNIFAHHSQYGEYLCKPKRVVAEGDDVTAEDKIDALWQYANWYIQEVCEFDAMGMSAVIGHRVMAEVSMLPHTRADEVIAWNQGIWADYEQRRAIMLAEGGEPDLDYSAHGIRPWRVAEVLAEGGE